MSIISLFKYLLEVSVCLAIFAAVYKLILSRLTHFSLMRFYLLTSLTISFVLPLVEIPVQWTQSTVHEPVTNTIQLFEERITSSVLAGSPNSKKIESTHDVLSLIFFGLLLMYVMGCIYKTYLFGKSLNDITRLIQKGEKKREKGYWIVSLENTATAFSFFQYMFIDKKYQELPPDQFQIIKEHEAAHIRHFHTLDVILIELMTIVLWFNPIVTYIKNRLKEIHEYTVDESVGGINANRRNYAHFLVTMAAENSGIQLATDFAGERLKNRILMMSKPRTSQSSKFLFLILLPLITFFLFAFSYYNYDQSSSNINVNSNNPWAFQFKLADYCGVYSSPNNSIKPVIIFQKEGKLFRHIKTGAIPGIPGSQDSSFWTTELQPEGKNIYSYGFQKMHKIKFLVNNRNQTIGCFYIQREGVEMRTYRLNKQQSSISCLKNPTTNSKIQTKITDIQLDLKKYCGTYYPSKRETNFGLKPMEIILKDNRLFVNGSVALNFETDSTFSYTDNSARCIKFDLGSKKEVTGCALLKFEAREHANYIVLQGEYLKGKK